jgi:glutamate-5-semialdehyde dehydrogenase
VVADSASADVLASAVYHSLDRKVCNTLNTICIVESRAEELVPIFLDSLDRAGERRGALSKLHVTDNVSRLIPADWFDAVSIDRAEGPVLEPRAQLIANDDLGVEWEWEASPEVTLTAVPNVDEAVALFNEQSPRLAASLISDDLDEQDRFFEVIDAPFVGNGFTRWVDGQYALDRPELGLSNWQFGRLFGRGGILSGDSVHTIRTRVVQSDPDIGR